MLSLCTFNLLHFKKPCCTSVVGFQPWPFESWGHGWFTTCFPKTVYGLAAFLWAIQCCPVMVRTCVGNTTDHSVFRNEQTLDMSLLSITFHSLGHIRSSQEVLYQKSSRQVSRCVDSGRWWFFHRPLMYPFLQKHWLIFKGTKLAKSRNVFLLEDEALHSE